MDRSNFLISAYFDGELTDAEMAELAAALGAGVESLDRFVLHSVIHSQLLDLTNQERVQDRAMAGAISSDDSSFSGDDWRSTAASLSAARTGPNESRLTSQSAQRRWLRFPSPAAMAAAVMIAASLSLVTYVIDSRPVYVGQLTDSTNSRWAGTHGNIPVGTLLENGQELQLISGRAVITFSSGAKVLLEGPCSLRLDSDMEVHLLAGRLAARVPRQAIGFTVKSTLARFIDLGTAFTLNLEAEKSFVLHVHEGLVELQLDKRFGKVAQHPARVAQVRAVSFNIKSGDVAFIPFEEGKPMPF